MPDKTQAFTQQSSARQTVIDLTAKGLTSREIAGRLYLSPNTVKIYSNSKLGVNNRTKAVVKAKTLRILPSS